MSMSHSKTTQVGFTTKHQKELIIQDLLAELNVELVLARYDTDLLGTFSGEIPRLLSHQEAAQKKAELAIELLDLPIGLGSEGSIGSDPVVPFLNSDIETLAWVDRERGYQLLITHKSFDIVARQKLVTRAADIAELVDYFDLPNHAVIVKTPSSGFLKKGISHIEDLKSALDAALKVSDEIAVETDFRAHLSPSRQQVIRECGMKLATALGSACPHCGNPGWMVTGHQYGLPCEHCELMVAKVAHSEILSCPKCPHQEVRSLYLQVADPALCDACNP